MKTSLKNRSRFWLTKVAALVVVCLLLGLYAFGILTIPGPFLATTLAVLFVLFLPSFLLARLLWRQPPPLPEQLALAFSLSVGLWSVPATLLLLLNGNLAMMTWVVLIITLLFTVAVLFRSSPGQAAQATLKPMNPPAISDQAVAGHDWPRLVYWVAFFATISLVLVIFANTAGPFRGDRLTYQAFLRHFLDAERFFTKGFRISSDLILRSARELIQTWVLLLALVTKLAQVDLLDAYVYYLPPLLILVSFFALYALAKELFNSQITALTACLVQALYYLSDIPLHESIGRSLFLRIVEDKFLIRFILLPVALWLTLRYLKQGGKGNLAGLIIAIVAVGLVHPMGVVLYGISSGLFFLMIFLSDTWQGKKEKLSRVIPIAGVVLLVTLVPLWQRHQVVSSEFGAQFFEVEQGVRFNERLLILSHKDDRYIASPNLIAHPLTILAILLTPLLFRYLRTHLSAQFLFANMAGVLILCYTPFLTPLLGKIIAPGMIWRVLWILPVSLVVSFFLGEATRELANHFRHVSSQGLQLVPLGAILVSALLLRGEIVNGLGQLEEFRSNALTAEERAVLAYLREHGIPGSVIMTPNPQLSDEIPGLVGHSYGITFREAPSLFASAPEDRIKFYEASLVTNAHLDILQQYHIVYVILETGTELAHQFTWFSSMFKPLYANRSYVLYQWQPELATEVDLNIVQGNTHFLRDDLAVAGMAYRRALERQPNQPLAAMGLGHLYVAEERIEDALAAYQQAITVIPSDPWPHLYLAEAYVAKGEMAEESEAYEKALEAYRQAFALASDNPEIRDALLKAYLALGDRYFGQDLLSEVIAAYEQDIELDPDNIQTYQKLGEVYETLGWMDEAIAVYTSMLARWPGRAETHFYLGRAYEAQDEIERAIAEYERAIDLQPTLAGAYIRLSSLYKDQNRAEEALVLYRAATRKNSNAAWPHLELGKIYLDQGVASADDETN